MPNAENISSKAQLISKIDGILKQRRFKQIAVADLLGIKQPDVSKILRSALRLDKTRSASFSRFPTTTILYHHYIDGPELSEVNL